MRIGKKKKIIIKDIFFKGNVKIFQNFVTFKSTRLLAGNHPHCKTIYQKRKKYGAEVKKKQKTTKHTFLQIKCSKKLRVQKFRGKEEAGERTSCN